MDWEEGKAGNSMTTVKKIKLATAGVLCLLVLIFLFQNVGEATRSVTVRFFFWPMEISLILLVLLFFFVGTIVGYALRWRRK